MLCELFPILQVALLVIGPCSVVTVLFLPPTSLPGKYFLVLPYSIVIEGHFVLVLKPGWLSLFLPMLIEGKLRMYHQFGGVESAHLPLVVFLTE